MKKRFLLLAGLSIMFCATSCKFFNKGKTEDSTKTAVVISTPQMLSTNEFNKKVININSSELDYRGDKPAIVDFYADWCGPCRMMAPMLEEIAKEYAGEIYVYKVNVDVELELSRHFNIKSLPTLMFIPMDEDPQILVGSMPKEFLVEKVNTILLNK